MYDWSETKTNGSAIHKVSKLGEEAIATIILVLEQSVTFVLISIQTNIRIYSYEIKLYKYYNIIRMNICIRNDTNI